MVGDDIFAKIVLIFVAVNVKINFCFFATLSFVVIVWSATKQMLEFLLNRGVTVETLNQVRSLPS